MVLLPPAVVWWQGILPLRTHTHTHTHRPGPNRLYFVVQGWFPISLYKNLPNYQPPNEGYQKKGFPRKKHSPNITT